MPWEMRESRVKEKEESGKSELKKTFALTQFCSEFRLSVPLPSSGRKKEIGEERDRVIIARSKRDIPC